MNAQAIETATILVRFADPPPEGKKQGTVKASDGTIYGVWPKDLGRFQPGGRYAIEFTSHTFKGKTYSTVIKCEPAPQSPAASGDARGARAPSPSQNSVSGGEGVTGEASEFEFVTRMLAAAMQICAVEMTPEGIAAKARMFRGVYREVFGANG